MKKEEYQVLMAKGRLRRKGFVTDKDRRELAKYLEDDGVFPCPDLYRYLKILGYV